MTLKSVKPGDVMIKGSSPGNLPSKLQGSIFRKKSKNNSIDDKVDNISDIKSMQFLDDK